MRIFNRTKNINLDTFEMIINELNLSDKLRAAKTILIKPNFAAGTYVTSDSHVVSDIELLSEIVSAILYLNKDATIHIAESDSTGHGFAYLKFEHFELPQALNIDNSKLDRVKLLDLSRDRLVRVENKQFRYFSTEDRQLWLSEKLIQADFLISLSNLKTHTVTRYTGACKNLFGCLPAFEKSSYHIEIHKVVHDLVLALKPNLNVVDAFAAMEKNGPVSGEAINCGYRVFSDDAVEADVCASQTVGLKAMQIRYLKYLNKTNIEIDYNQISQPIIVKLKGPSGFVKVMNAIGLEIQRFGMVIEAYGHRLHACTNLLQVVIATIRPLLLKFVSIDTLKRIKRKVVKG